MPRNASGVYTLPGGNPVTPGDVIEASWANTTLEDVANELTNSLSRTGAGGMLAPFRIADGNVSAPGLSFLNETNTGLYRAGSGTTWFSVLGVDVAQFSTVGLTIPFGKALTALGNASVSGTFGVTGSTTLASTLAVTGAITATGGVVGNVTGNIIALGGSSSFNDVIVSGSLDMTAGSSATITGLSTPTNSSDAANKGYVDDQVATRLALAGGIMSGAIDMSNSKITGVGTPTSSGDAANKGYVDSVAQGLDVKGSCRAATTANITLSGAQTIDGVAIIAGDRVLVKDQSAPANNGIYVAAAGAWSRATDADTWAELVGAFTFVEEGTVNDNSGWVCTSPAGGTLGSTAVTWEQFSGAGQITAGAGLTKTGNTINVGTASSSRIVVNTDDIDLALSGVGAGTYKSVTVDNYGRVTAGTNPTTLSGFGITNAYTKTEVDSGLALKLNLAGGTMTGAIAMGANRITGLADPTSAQDAATKIYIDTIFGSTITAAASAAAAASSASSAATSASSASQSALDSSNAATSSIATYTTFNNQYLGSKASDPSTNNSGGALVAGNLYWNSTTNEMRVYSGSAWTVAYVPSGSYMNLTTNQTAAGVKTFSDNMGVGVTPSAWSTGKAFELGSKGNGLWSFADGAVYFTSNSYYNGGWKYGTTTASGNYQISGGVHAWSTAPSGTAGNAITFTQAMTLDASGRLGIGTTSPSAPLHVSSTPGAGSASAINLGNAQVGSGFCSINYTSTGFNFAGVGGSEFLLLAADTGPLSLATFASNPIKFITNQAERARIDSSGNLGLGVTPYAWRSTYKAFDTVYGAFYGATLVSGISNNATYTSTNWIYRDTQAAVRYEQNTGAHLWFTAPSGTAGTAITFTQAMTLNASGQLGVGTTTPDSQLTVNGAASSRINMRAANTRYATLYADSGVFAVASITAIPLVFGINDVEKARVDSTGALLVGTATNRGVGGLSINPNTSAGAADITFNRNSTASTSYVVGFQNAGSTVGYISYTNSATTYATSSDARLKENVSAAPDAGPVIDSIQIRSFDWKVGGHQTFGVVAQELVLVAPEAVAAPEDPDQMMGVDYSKLVPMMIKEIQSLRARVATLEGV